MATDKLWGLGLQL